MENTNTMTGKPATEIVGVTETKKYIIKCDDCKKTIRETGDVEESYAGGRCDKCKEGKQMKTEMQNRAEGLIEGSTLLELGDKVIKIQEDLTEDGFDNEDIETFITEVVKRTLRREIK